jgi:hypothetical protein
MNVKNSDTAAIIVAVFFISPPCQQFAKLIIQSEVETISNPLIFERSTSLTSIPLKSLFLICLRSQAVQYPAGGEKLIPASITRFCAEGMAPPTVLHLADKLNPKRENPSLSAGKPAESTIPASFERLLR